MDLPCCAVDLRCCAVGPNRHAVDLRCHTVAPLPHQDAIGNNRLKSDMWDRRNYVSGHGATLKAFMRH